MQGFGFREDGGWRFLTSHIHVLACLHRRPDQTIREIASATGISDRATAHVLAQLEEGGYLTRRRAGRRNVYELHLDVPLRHPLHAHRTVGDLLRFLDPGSEARAGE